MNIFNSFLERVLNFPLWIKQALYLRLEKEIDGNISQNIFSNCIPELTFKGQNELKERSCGFDSNIYNFLKEAEKGLSIIEIAVNSYFSMEEAAKYFVFCIEQNFINLPESNQTFAMAKFMAGKIRTGEYLKEIGKISDEQLQQAVLKCEKDSSKKFAQILTDLGFIKKEDVKSLLVLKEEAKKRFVLDYNSVPQTKSVFANEKSEFENEINNLKEENKRLKQKMQKLLELVREK